MPCFKNLQLLSFAFTFGTPPCYIIVWMHRIPIASRLVGQGNLMRTCSNCRHQYTESFNEDCPKCGCPYDDGDFDSGEEADAAMRTWYDQQIEDEYFRDDDEGK